MQTIEDRIVKPTVEGLKKDRLPYKGFIFIGLIVVNNEPLVIEYNVRMGDPETEAVIPRINTDLVELFMAVKNQTLNQIQLQINPQAATTVMLVSGGYPEAYEKGKEIHGIMDVKEALVFHAGAQQRNKKIVTSGGRVMAITAFGQDYKSALKTAYGEVSKINFEGMNFRTDLGFDL